MTGSTSKKRQVWNRWPAHGIRIPDGFWKLLQSEATFHGLDAGEYVIQMRHFAKSKGLDKWLSPDTLKASLAQLAKDGPKY